MRTDRGETINKKNNKGRKRKTTRNPYPTTPNLTTQDCGWPAAAATGSAPWDTIIGFHYAAVSLK